MQGVLLLSLLHKLSCCCVLVGVFDALLQGSLASERQFA
jgi:hypothetical protein